MCLPRKPAYSNRCDHLGVFGS
ncbi:hypothetical protein BVI2075_200056 [Burkholderia vietnamiensis]|nr:hypothetical protein BVI2075_200056 [Burkholderia vietnamiensis]